MEYYQKSPRSREPQASSRKSQKTFSKPNYSIVRVGNKVVGKVVGGEFVKKVHSTKHFLRTPPAIAFDIDSLNQARNLGATRVKIIDLDTGVIYRVTIEVILKKGFLFNRGHGDQIGLPLNIWSHNRVQQPSLFEPIIPVNKRSQSQSRELRR